MADESSDDFERPTDTDKAEVVTEGLPHPNSEIWTSIDEFMNTPGALKSIREGVVAVEYQRWLLDNVEGLQCGDEKDDPCSPPWTEVPNDGEEKDGIIRHSGTPRGRFERTHGKRSVEFDRLMHHMDAIVRNAGWSAHDILKVSRLPGTEGTDGLFIEDGHTRLCALDSLLWHFFHEKKQLPIWLVKMATRIRIKYLGHATRGTALARSIGEHAFLEHGVTDMSWLDVFLQASEGQTPDSSFFSLSKWLYSSSEKLLQLVLSILIII